MDNDKDAWERGMEAQRRWREEHEARGAPAWQAFVPLPPPEPTTLLWRQADERLVTKDVAEWLAEWFSKESV